MNDQNQLSGYNRRLERHIAIAVSIFLVLTVLLYFAYPADLGKKQPIPFSHHLHSTVKQISCVFCHDTAINSAQAGIPPLQRCMLCHNRIITSYPPLIDLKNYYDSNTPVEWIKVSNLPDHVHFYHDIHIASGFDCLRCHGDIANMDRVVLVNKFEMGFCIKCHRDQKASIDCFNCHH
jgi:hypothetical protein